MKVEIPHWQRGDPMEGADLLTIRKLVTLSKQQFMDYDHERDPIEPNSCDSRCKGGLMDSAFEYTLMVRGLLFFFGLVFIEETQQAQKGSTSNPSKTRRPKSQRGPTQTSSYKETTRTSKTKKLYHKNP